MAIHIHPVKIPPRYYKPIGEVAVGWNLTEALLTSIVWHIQKTKDPKLGRLLVYRVNAGEKLKILRASIRAFAKAAHKPALTALVDRASQLKTKRNMIVHGWWGRMPNEHKTWKLFYHRDTNDMLLLKREVMDVSGLKAIASQIDQLNHDMKKWMTQNSVPPDRKSVV